MLRAALLSAGLLLTVIALPCAGAAPVCDMVNAAVDVCVPPHGVPEHYADARSTIDQALDQTDEGAGFAFYCISTGPRIGFENNRIYCGERRII